MDAELVRAVEELDVEFQRASGRKDTFVIGGWVELAIADVFDLAGVVSGTCTRLRG